MGISRQVCSNSYCKYKVEENMKFDETRSVRYTFKSSNGTSQVENNSEK